jgi:AHBA synthesis associated protein
MVARGALRRYQARAYDLVVFDLDGVLTDSAEVMRQAFAAAHKRVKGQECDEAKVAAFLQRMGLPLATIMQELELPSEMVEPYVEVSRRLLHQTRVFPGVSDMLTLLVELGVHMGVASGKTGARARELLEAHALDGFFELILGCDDVACPKPAADILATHVARAGATQYRTLMIGDAEVDLRCADAAGIDFALAAWDANYFRADRDNIYVCATPADVVRVVRGDAERR